MRAEAPANAASAGWSYAYVSMRLDALNAVPTGARRRHRDPSVARFGMVALSLVGETILTADGLPLNCTRRSAGSGSSRTVAEERQCARTAARRIAVARKKLGVRTTVEATFAARHSR